MEDRKCMLIEIEKTFNEVDFSGVLYALGKHGNFVNQAYGYANRADHLLNNSQTRFGIASGCKLFTAIAICQLVEKNKLSFDTKLADCLNIDFPFFDKEITIHHLLTHTSGIPDYFDEDVMDDFEDLWKNLPMYQMNHLKDFLPLFQNQKMMFSPGGKFHYNNAGYIVLGLIV